MSSPHFQAPLISWFVCLSVSFFLSPQRSACLLSALLTSFPSLACESLCWLQIYYLVFLESFPPPPASVSSLPHYFILYYSPQSTSASKANGDGELSMLFVYRCHEKSLPMAFTLYDGKAGKHLVLCGLKPTVPEADFLQNFQPLAKRRKRAVHTQNIGMHMCAQTFKHTGLPSN